MVWDRISTRSSLGREKRLVVGVGDDVGGFERWVRSWVSYVEDMVNSTYEIGIVAGVRSLVGRYGAEVHGTSKSYLNHF